MFLLLRLLRVLRHKHWLAAIIILREQKRQIFTFFKQPEQIDNHRVLQETAVLIDDWAKYDLSTLAFLKNHFWNKYIAHLCSVSICDLSFEDSEIVAKPRST